METPLKEIAMQYSVTIEDRQAQPLEMGRRLPAVAVLLFGLVLVYAVGFVSIPAVHNATHDARHAAGFPCH
jgi:cobalt transporter subunit CbtB